MFMAIIRQVRFSMRSAFGSCVFALEYSFHICVPSGSFFCISSGDSTLGLPASLPNAGKMVSSSMPRRAASSAGEKSILPARTAKSIESRAGTTGRGGSCTCLSAPADDDVAAGSARALGVGRCVPHAANATCNHSRRRPECCSGNKSQAAQKGECAQ
jgi:hypothetical protein